MTPLQSCCGGQAAEVEKHERLQALASARTPSLSISASEEKSTGIVTGGTGIVTRGSILPHKDMRGPWDGLGINRRDMVLLEGQQADQTKSECPQDATSHLNNARKRLAPSSVQSVVSQRLKIVDMKPDVCQKTASSTGLVREVESTTTSQWEGLVGYYGSEDSDDN